MWSSHACLAHTCLLRLDPPGYRRDDFRRDSHSDRREPRDRERDARRPDERERDRYGRDRDGLDGRVRDGLDRREEPGRREQVEGAGGTRERSEHVGAGVAEEEGAAEPPALPSIGDAAKKKEVGGRRALAAGGETGGYLAACNAWLMRVHLQNE